MASKLKRRQTPKVPRPKEGHPSSRRHLRRVHLRCVSGGPRLKRVLILTADAGSGHRSAARAVEAALQERYAGRCETQIVNPMHLPGAPPILRLAEESYLEQITHVPEWYQFQYEATDSWFLARLLQLGAAVLLQRPIRHFLESRPPDVIVSVYPLYARAVAEAGKDLGHSFLLTTIVTDLVSVHTAWFERAVDLCLVPTDAVSEKALQNGLSAQQVKVTGIPVHPRLAHAPADRGALRAALGWDPQRPAVLVLGGGAGVGRLAEIAHEIARRCPAAQMAVVAGKNEELQRRLESRSWPIPTLIYGFTDRMPDLMHASDVLVTKAGGLTVSEGLACGLPMVVHQVTPGQEEGNLAYLETHDAGVYAATPEEVGEILMRWLRPNSEELSYYAANAREIGRPLAAYQAATRIWKLLGEGG